MVSFESRIVDMYHATMGEGGWDQSLQKRSQNIHRNKTPPIAMTLKAVLYRGPPRIGIMVAYLEYSSVVVLDASCYRG